MSWTVTTWVTLGPRNYLISKSFGIATSCGTGDRSTRSTCAAGGPCASARSRSPRADSAFRDHLHRPVAQVAGEPPEPETRRLSPHPPAEPHALDVAVHEEAHGSHSGPTLSAPARRAGGTTRCRSPRSPPAPATQRARRVRRSASPPD